MSKTAFTCERCGRPFNVKPEVSERYPGWEPQLCWPCKSDGQGKPAARRPAASRRQSRAPRPASRQENLSRRQVLQKYTKGPKRGVFTDGACTGNPGPGGWGAVWVENDRVIAERHGHEPHTTNNRMELTALINAYEMLPEDAAVTIYSDSNLCVQTLNQWAAGWKRRGWKRKGGAVKNLELVQRAYELSLRHPKTHLRWIKAHDGSRWNEYADSLATVYLRRS